MEEGKPEAGLASLEQAVKENPQSIEYRTYLQRQRETYINQLQGKADADRDLGRFEQAEAGYLSILKVDAGCSGKHFQYRLQICIAELQRYQLFKADFERLFLKVRRVPTLYLLL